ncbi:MULTISPECIES: DNA polymerase III subunit delta [Trichocoleus]|uniref:DNA polymerase III subunit delta n=1 Tax=Trichocoleus desertorum GB2-A4 TaxID=2933944 RepID=A0ABV0J954_9CYAN|nr:DNA polymerase III subunit delta [Trichocoleus sp. FACHB-46]MBD1861168.1 DNA polymerase III subunit delta [Trichocoleus sp. FACHB-46]
MPIYLYWGEDDFAIAKAVTTLRDRTLDPDWTSFNFDKISAEQSNAVLQALTQAMTPPFGMGKRLVWLENTTLGQQCPETVLAELERTLPAIPDASVLLLTARNKPDGRLKSTKLLQKYAEIKEFSPIPPWKTDQLLQQVRQVAQTVGVALTQPSMELLAESVGNNSRQLYSELEKLRLYAGDRSQPLEAEVVARLVVVNTQNSLQLAAAIRQGQVGEALELVAGLLSHNEPALRVVATLIGQFRTWLWVKLMQEAGERDERAIAQAAEVSNPKRIYFLQQEVRGLSSQQLQQTLPLLLELELSLKQGAEELATLQTKVVELCQIYQR